MGKYNLPYSVLTIIYTKNKSFLIKLQVFIGFSAKLKVLKDLKKIKRFLEILKVPFGLLLYFFLIPAGKYMVPTLDKEVSR